MPLRASILTPSPVPGCALRLPPAFACAPSCRTACPTFHVHQVAHHHRSVADRPNGLSAAWPCLQRAFAAYPRPGEAGPAVFHGPIARGQALDSPGLPRPTDADEQTTTGSVLQGEGSWCARCADVLKSICLPLATLSLGAARESGGVKQFAALLARENQGCACCRVVRSRPTARMTASMVFRVGLPLSLNER